MLFGQLIFDGLAIGLVFVILACGFIIIMSISKILFLAYGAFYTIGAYGTWYAIQYLHIHYLLRARYRSIDFNRDRCDILFPDLPAAQVKNAKQGFYGHTDRFCRPSDVTHSGGCINLRKQSRSIPNVFPGIITPLI